MKYLKRFNETILNEKTHKFCHECGRKLETIDTFCDECGTKQEESDKTFTINGIIETEYPNGQKTPNFILVSDNKTLSGTPIQFDKTINKYNIPTGKEVSITGTTKNSQSPNFNNGIFVSKKEDIRIK